MKKIVLSFSLSLFALGISAQDQIKMIWCEIKDAGKLETVALTEDCLNESPRFWIQDKGEVKCLGFKVAVVNENHSIVYTSTNGEVPDKLMESFRTKSVGGVIEFFDVIVQNSSGETMLSDEIYKLKYKFK